MKRISKDGWITVVIVAAMIGAATLGLYLPQGRKLESIRTDIASRKLALESDAQRVSCVPDMLRHIQGMKQRYQGFDRRLPKRKELAGFLREISSILASERLTNQSTEPGDPSKEELFHTLPIKMKFQGSYLSLASLLERIDRMERLTRVQKLSVGRNPKN